MGWYKIPIDLQESFIEDDSGCNTNISQGNFFIWYAATSIDFLTSPSFP